MRVSSSHHGLTILSIITFLIVLSACQPNSPGGRASVAMEVPLVVDEIRVGVSSDETSIRMTPQTSKDPINVAVKTSGTSEGASLEVKVFDLSDGQLVASETRHLKVSASTVTDLKFKRETGWRPGRHLVEVKLDGKLVGQRDIDVVDMPAETEAKK